MSARDLSNDGLLSSLLNAAPDAIVVADSRGRIVFVNAQTEHVFGYSRAELIGQPVEILVPESVRAGHVAHREHFARETRLRAMGSGLELAARRKDGTELPVEISLSPVQTDQGLLVSAAIRDVTERKRIEILTRWLAAIVDASQDAIIGMTLDGEITSFNRGACQMLGWAAEEVIGQSITLLVPIGREPEVLAGLEAVRRGETIARTETLRRRKDGKEITVSATISPVRDSLGRLVGASVIDRDVSDAKQAEDALRRANQYLLNAVESFQGAFALFDADDRLVLCNSGYRALFGHGIEGNLGGHAYSEILETTLASGVLDLGDQTIDEMRSRWQKYHRAPEGVFELRTRAGQTIRLIDRRTADGGVVSTTWDITSDVERERELREARAAAETANAAKSDFLASMSHELRTPLNAVLGFSQLLERDKRSPLTDRQLARLHHVIKGGEHLLRLIDEVLDLSRIEAGRVALSPEEVEVADVLGDVVSTLEPMAARAEVALEVGGLAPARVTADRTRFAQILMNFGSNAIKYGRHGGHARFASTLSDGHVRVSVVDDGPGIAPDKHDRVFQPFQRAGQEAGPIEGTGIGLALSKRLAEIMGGRVGFASTPGTGSEFWVELPVRAPSEKAPSSPPPRLVKESPLAGPGARHVVVYVEDNPSNIAFMEELMRDLERITLLVAPTAEIGIELARAHRPELVIMDINLPGMSGLEAVKRLRQFPETRSTPVVGLSAAAMARDAKRAEEAGFSHYLTKPVKVDDLCRILEELLVKEAPQNA